MYISLFTFHFSKKTSVALGCSVVYRYVLFSLALFVWGHAMSCDTARRRKTIRALHRPTVDLFDCVNGSLATNMFVIYLLVVFVVKPSSCFFRFVCLLLIILTMWAATGLHGRYDFSARMRPLYHNEHQHAPCFQMYFKHMFQWFMGYTGYSWSPNKRSFKFPLGVSSYTPPPPPPHNSKQIYICQHI